MKPEDEKCLNLQVDDFYPNSNACKHRPYDFDHAT